MTPMRILVIGQSGQLARALVDSGRNSGVQIDTLGRPALDLGAPDQARNTLESRLTGTNRADLVINTAAFTAVDAAEGEEATAFQLNRDAVRLLAEVCAAADCPLIHVSTDYVFSGKPGRPWRVDDQPAPVSAYGASKLAGEAALAQTWSKHIILRTAWLFSEHAPNFMTKIMERARTQSIIQVVNDQIGSPTPARDLATTLLDMARQVHDGATPWGLYHYAGDTAMSWADFAEAIIREAGLTDCRIERIASSDFPAAAERPPWSVLDSHRTSEVFGCAAADFKVGLSRAVHHYMRLT